MTKQDPYGQYAVYSLDRHQALFPNAVPNWFSCSIGGLTKQTRKSK